MDVVGPDQCDPPPGGTAVTIGAYDGVHLGHRALLAELARLAASKGLATAVVTFDRHPATVVRPDSAPTLLNDLDQKLELLAECGIDRTLVVPFDRDRADETAEEFVNEVLVGDLGARLVVVGQDFHFGHGRKGNVEVLRELGAVAGFDVVGVNLTGTDGDPVSSTRIRGLVAEGSVEAAAALLGRPHQLRGTVVHGDGRGGAVLGMPTANVELADGLAMPGEGIYAGYYERPDGSTHPAAISLGRRLTFYEAAPPLLEAHLIDWTGDLYGEKAKVSFVARLRPDQRFDSVEALIDQMNRDVDEARRRLATDRAGR
jgi:riboflavin kinase/FMN adenylyltransferase